MFMDLYGNIMLRSESAGTSDFSPVIGLESWDLITGLLFPKFEDLLSSLKFKCQQLGIGWKEDYCAVI